MKGILIFTGGVITGASIALGVSAFIKHRRDKYEFYDLNEEDLYEDCEPYVPEESKEPEKKENEMISNEEQKEADEFNKVVSDYVEENKEIIRVLEPTLLTKEEFDESPFTHCYYQWFTQDQLLVDDELNVVTDNRCGRDFVDIVERDGICWVTNDEIEEVYEIEKFDDCSIDDIDTSPLE